MTEPIAAADSRSIQARRRLVRALPVLVLVVMLVVAVVVAVGWRAAVARTVEERLTGAVAEIVSGIEARVASVQVAVSSVRGLHDVTGSLDADDVRSFTEAVTTGRPLEQRVTGLTRLLVLEPADGGVTVALSTTPGSARPGSWLALSDVATSTLDRATELGLPVVSPALPGDDRARLGGDLVVATPLYAAAAARSTTAPAAARQAAVTGWVVGVVDADRLLHGTGALGGTELALVAYDGTRAEPSARLGADPAGHEPDPGPLSRNVVVNLEGRTWLLAVDAREGFVGAFERWQWLLVLAAGTAGAVLLALLVSQLVTSRDRALAMVDEATGRLAAANAELVAANRELTDFTGVVSHDLKAPLTAVIGYLELLRLDLPDLADEPKDFFGRATAAATRMARLIDQLLAFARAGQLLTDLEPVALDDAVAEAAANQETVMTARKVTLDVAELPEVDGDRARLVQLFQNLIGNAIKFTPDDRAPIVRIEAGRAGDTWHVVVADNGAGIPADDRDRLLRPFQRGRSANAEGAGLGLAICCRIVEAHGGRLWLDDTDLGGTAVCLELPARLPGPSVAV